MGKCLHIWYQKFSESEEKYFFFNIVHHITYYPYYYILMRRKENRNKRFKEHKGIKLSLFAEDMVAYTGSTK